MAQSTCLVSLPQMVDLALNTTELGTVNFHILHSVLHVIIKQLELTECKVEFRGVSGDKVQNALATTKAGPAINLTEYVVTAGGERKAKKEQIDIKKISKEEVQREKELKVIEQRKNSKEEPAKDPPSMAPGEPIEVGADGQTLVVIEQADGDIQTPLVSVAVPKTLIDSMHQDVEDLKIKISELIELPSNVGLIDAVRQTVDKSNPVLDMFQILTLIKRADACEIGLNKLASMIEDLARSGLGHGEHRSSMEVTNKGTGTEGGQDVLERLTKLESINDEFADLKGCMQNICQKLEPLMNDDLIAAMTKMSESGGEIPGGGGKETEEMINAYITKLENSINNNMTTMQNQLNELEREMGIVVERLNAGGGGGGGELSGDVNNRLLGLAADLETLTETTAKLLEEKEERQKHIDELNEEIELLKTVKADREDLEDALADKADACAVNRKVSHDQFDSACDDLSRGIEEALTKLTQQESLWQQALEDIQNEIGLKLDKVELTPLRDFINNKLKMLQNRLKALAALKRDSEAAGTKSKFLRNVNCISCDKDVIMRKEMDPTLMPPPVSLPPTRSMGPYLAYELDALRKQQKCLPGSRNMNHFESALGAKGGVDDDHICNRYCGGSHTTTTPQQRVTRLGHFLTQWGPEMQPMNEGQIRGTDGQMYKARDIGEKVAPEKESLQFYPSMKARPSMVVQGDIVAARQNMKNILTDMSSEKGEEPKAPTEAVEERRPSGEKRPSTDRRMSGEKRPSTDRRVSGEKRLSQEKRPSTDRRASGEKRHSGSIKADVEKKPSAASLKQAGSAVKQPGSATAAAPPAAEATAAPEGEQQPPAEEAPQEPEAESPPPAE